MEKSVQNEIKQIIKNQKLNCFLKNFQEKVDWNLISQYPKLSESFIREFQEKIDWDRISKYQKLSENFIKEFQEKINWYEISCSQKLSENFIREFQEKLNWYLISKYQKLSESFIREFQKKLNWDYISQYQKLSEKFRDEFKIEISENCWLYKTAKFKREEIEKTGLYKIRNNKIVAYKGIRSDDFSKEDKIKEQIKKHTQYIDSFKKEQSAFSVEYKRNNNRYTWSAMCMMIQEDLNKRVKNILKILEK